MAVLLVVLVFVRVLVLVVMLVLGFDFVFFLLFFFLFLFLFVMTSSGMQRQCRPPSGLFVVNPIVILVIVAAVDHASWALRSVA